MAQLYTLLVGAHIFAAIICVGPVFIFNRILKSAKNMEELRYAHKIVGKLHSLASIGFGVILISGLSLGWINPSLFHMLWFDLSLILFFVSGVYMVTVIKAKTKPLHEIIHTSKSEEIPEEYRILSQKKAPYDWLDNAILVTIMILMVFKPN